MPNAIRPIVVFAVASILLLSGLKYAHSDDLRREPSEKARQLALKGRLAAQGSQYKYAGLPRLLNDKWKFKGEFKSRSGIWEIWEVESDYHYPNGRITREFHESLVQGDHVTGRLELAIDGLASGFSGEARMAPDKKKPKLKIDDKAFRSAEKIVIQKITKSAIFRRNNLDRTLRELIEEEAVNQLSKTTK